MSKRPTNTFEDEAQWNDVPERGKEAVVVIGDAQDRRRERIEHYRAPLKIPTPKASAELLKKWHGMPPSKPQAAPVRTAPAF